MRVEKEGRCGEIFSGFHEDVFIFFADFELYFCISYESNKSGVHLDYIFALYGSRIL